MILADDHVMVAEGLGRLVGEVADLVAQVENGKQLVEAVQRLKPDIVVSDVTMPVMSGLEALRQLKAGGSKTRFIFLTVHTEPQLATQAIRDGACGYLLKAAAGEELLDAIRAVMADRIYLTPHITKDVLQTMSRSTDGGGPSLSSRQLEVLRLIAQGKRMKEIAAQLGISVRTVEDHKSQLLAALGVKSTADLVKFAIKQGLVPE
ncbi:response regulator transcription factor [Bradyrhizobium sp. CCGUVB1N3]|uniref:response regulator n=1 Tax=Bradyrhizobium sp. CCGUVB1N3 TaxID=2949629 RepID=UPI0021154DD7|nr:response regulator transcription factor [Bradyrhizobium sp. CCGUVB1N3]